MRHDHECVIDQKSMSTYNQSMIIISSNMKRNASKYILNHAWVHGNTHLTHTYVILFIEFDNYEQKMITSLYLHICTKEGLKKIDFKICGKQGYRGYQLDKKAFTKCVGGWLRWTLLARVTPGHYTSIYWGSTSKQKCRRYGYKMPPVTYRAL